MDMDKTHNEKARWELQKNANILNWSEKRHLKKQHLYGHLPPISKTIQIRRTPQEKHGWTREVFLWNLQHRQVSVSRPKIIYQQQFCPDTGCWLEDLPGAIADKNQWAERERDWERDLVNPCYQRNLLIIMNSESFNGYHLHNAKLFERIEVSVAVKYIFVNKTKIIHKR